MFLNRCTHLALHTISTTITVIIEHAPRTPPITVPIKNGKNVALMFYQLILIVRTYCHKKCDNFILEQYLYFYKY